MIYIIYIYIYIHAYEYRTTNPRILIELLPTIFKQLLTEIGDTANTTAVGDNDNNSGNGNDDTMDITTNNTTTTVTIDTLIPTFKSFLSPHLSYAFIGVIQWLCDEIFFS